MQWPTVSIYSTRHTVSGFLYHQILIGTSSYGPHESQNALGSIRNFELVESIQKADIMPAETVDAYT
jgi:hypothetical protein